MVSKGRVFLAVAVLVAGEEVLAAVVVVIIAISLHFWVS